MAPPPPWLQLLLALALAVAGPAASAQGAGSCQIFYQGKDVTDCDGCPIILTDYDPVYDNLGPESTPYTFTTTNMKNGEGNRDPYFEWDFGQGSLTMVTTAQFPHREEKETNKLIQLPLNYICGEVPAKQKLVVFNLFDTNNHDPDLEEAQYEYKVPMPLPSGFDLTQVYGSITGRDIDITSKGVDAALDSIGNQYFVAEASKVVGKAYSVTLRTRTMLRLEKQLTFQLTVTDRGTEDDKTTRSAHTTVIITPDMEESVFIPRFREPLYTADLRDVKDPQGALPLDQPIDFEEGYTTDLEYYLTSGLPGTGHHNYFELKTENGLEVHWKTDPDDLQELLREPFALLKLEARNPKAAQPGLTVIHLTLPGAVPDTTTTPEPCPTTTEAPTTTECPVCPTTPEPLTTTECPTAPSTTECPVCPTTLEPLTTTECPVCPTTPEPLTTTECPTAPSTTECPVCSTTFEPMTTTECVCPTTDSPTSDSSVQTECPTVSTECPECPSVSTDISTTPTECPTLPTECSTTTVCPECPCEETTTSTTESGPSASTEPATECPTTCPTFDSSTMCPTSCPVCPTTPSCPGDGGSTPTDEPGTQLQFDQAEYWEELPANAPLGYPVANPSVSPQLPNTVFSLEKVGNTPTGYLSINPSTGAVTLRRQLPIGTRTFLLRATAPGARPATAELTVSVPNVFLCGDDQPVFEDQLQVVNATERPERQQLLPALGLAPGCTYRADDALQHSEYFAVDSATGAVWLLAVDRESEQFGGAEVPILMFTLIRDCPEESEASAGQLTRVQPVTRRPRGDFNARLVETVERVPYNPNTTYVWVLLNDANDNPPLFRPAELTVGYPGPQLAARLRPPALFTAQATDADAGENAALLYSLDEAGEAVLAVHPVSGAVYPREGAQLPADGLRFTVRATDRRGQPGDSGTLTGTLSVTAVPLSLEHLLELSVRGKLAEDADELVQGEPAGEGRELRVLSAAVLPAAERDSRAFSPARGRRSADDDDEDGSSGEADEAVEPVLRLLVYALKDGQPVPTDDYKEELKQSLQPSGLVDARPPETGGGGGGDSGSNEAAVVALSVLLALALLAVAGLAAYFWAIRPRLAARAHKQLSQSDASSINGKSSLRSVVADIEPLSEDILKKPPPEREQEPASEPGPSQLVSLSTGDWETPQDAAPDLSLLAEPSIPRPSVMLGGTWHESADTEDSEPAASDPAPGDADPEKGDDPEAKAARRKSRVVFNEAVDCIEIDRL